MTGSADMRETFPGPVWGVLLLLDLLSFYYRKPPTEADIDQELARRR